MPFIVPVLASIGSFLASAAPALTAVGAGLGVGEGIYNLTQQGGGGGGGGAPTQQPVAPPTTAPNATSPQAALLAATAPDVQAQTGGALSPPAFAQMLANLVGQPGEAQQAQNIEFGSGGQGLTDMLATLQPAQSLTTPSGGG